MAKKARNTRRTRFAAKVNSMLTVMKTVSKDKPPVVTGVPNLKSPLLNWGTSRRRGRWLVVDATRNCALHIGAEAVRRAAGRVRQSTNCVVAQAVCMSALGPYVDGANVGTNITKVWNAADQVELRFHTGLLGPAVRIYDRTTKWVLEDSVYFLNPIPKSLRLGYKPKKKDKTIVVCKRKKKRAPASRSLLKLGELRSALVAAAMPGKKK